MADRPAFDPIWGTLGAPAQEDSDPWANRSELGVGGVAIDAEILGDGFHVSGEIHIGQFDRLSGWLNMKSGFIQVDNACHVHTGRPGTENPYQPKSTIWVHLAQVILVAETSPVQQFRPGAPVVQKERREVSIVTPDHSLRGSIHVHANGAMNQFLEAADPHFLAMTNVTVRWLSDPARCAQFPFALINRAQLVTISEESASPTDQEVPEGLQSACG
jgi:hypothetical protein